MSTSPESRPPLDPDAFAALPAPFRVEVVATAPSTNAVVADRARGGGHEGLVVIAEHQSAGRGRLDRQWVTPPRAAVTFSVLLRPVAPAPRWPLLGLLAGLGVVEGVASAGGPAVALKWPNDVLSHDGLKVAGLLLERIETAGGPAAVLGIGLNVTTTREELPVSSAGSLVTAGMVDPDRTEVARCVVEAVVRHYVEWTSAQDHSVADRLLLAQYTERCDTLGREVEVQLPTGEVFSGRATGLDGTGALMVEGATGTQRVQAGDVVHVRVE